MMVDWEIMYDLTAVLTTIAACSASIVAILGGFIASKLIALNAERDEVSTRISEIDEEIDFFTIERDMLQAQLDEDDALDFVGENISNLIYHSALDDIYKEENRPRLSKDILLPYWNRAEQVLEILSDFLHSPEGSDYEQNEDGIPIKVARSLTQDFEYKVCEKICNYFEEQQSPLSALSRSVGVNISSARWYDDTEEKVMSADNKITYLMLQKKQQTTRCKALEKPKGMKVGLVLFALFSAINIVCPLCLSPFQTDNYQLYLVAKRFAILTFSLGLTLIMCYLVYLLHWGNQSNKHKKS